MKEIVVIVDEKYGLERIYPANEPAELFCRLLSQRTLTRRDIEIIKQMGYSVKVEQPVVTL